MVATVIAGLQGVVPGEIIAIENDEARRCRLPGELWILEEECCRQTSRNRERIAVCCANGAKFGSNRGNATKAEIGRVSRTTARIAAVWLHTDPGKILGWSCNVSSWVAGIVLNEPIDKSIVAGSASRNERLIHGIESIEESVIADLRLVRVVRTEQVHGMFADISHLENAIACYLLLHA